MSEFPAAAPHSPQPPLTSLRRQSQNAPGTTCSRHAPRSRHSLSAPSMHRACSLQHRGRRFLPEGPGGSPREKPARHRGAEDPGTRPMLPSREMKAASAQTAARSRRRQGPALSARWGGRPTSDPRARPLRPRSPAVAQSSRSPASCGVARAEARCTRLTGASGSFDKYLLSACCALGAFLRVSDGASSEPRPRPSWSLRVTWGSEDKINEQNISVVGGHRRAGGK